MVSGRNSSQGCAACKKRKIKCDEVRPQCHRCRLIKRPCPGYQEVEGWKFRSENSRVFFKVHSYLRSADTSGQASPTRTLFITPDDNLAPESSRNQSGIVCLTGLSEHLPLRNNEYVKSFLEDYVIPSDQQGEPGWLSFLPMLYDSTEEGSALRLSVDAAALAHYGNKHSTPQALVIAQENYGSALRITHLELARRKVALTKPMMAAVFVMGLYEYIAGNGHENYWHAHLQGFRTLLSLQTPSDLEALQVMGLLETILCQTQRENVDLRRRPGPQDKLLLQHLPSGTSSQMVTAVYRSSELLATAHTATLSSDESTEFHYKLLDIIASLTEFDTGLKICTTREPHIDSIVANFRGIRICNIYRILRIIVNESILQCTMKLTQRPISNACQVGPEQSLGVIEEMCREVLETVPMCLGTDTNLLWPSSSTPAGAGRAYFLLWPLHVIHQCPYVKEFEKGYVQDVLTFIGNYYGLKHALELIQVTPVR